MFNQVAEPLFAGKKLPYKHRMTVKGAAQELNLPSPLLQAYTAAQLW
mgnify:CR=1 FL=1